MWRRQCPLLSPAETLPPPKPQCISTGGVEGPPGVVAVLCAGSQIQKVHRAVCSEGAEQPNSTDPTVYNGGDTSLGTGDGDKVPTHSLAGLAGMTAVGSEW